MKIIYYPKCSTCKKAEKYLNDKGLTYETQDIKLDNPNYEQIEHLFTKSGLPLKKFFNTSGLVYREMGLKDKLQSLSIKEQLHLLASDGMLIKRPILETEDAVLVGFKEAEYDKLFL